MSSARAWACASIAVLTVVVGGLAIAWRFSEPRRKPRPPHNLHETYQRLQMMDIAIKAYWSETDRPPSGSNADIVMALIDKNILNGRECARIGFTQNGRYVDGWGRPFRFVVSESPDRTAVRVYSLGPDGLDAAGHGDDVGLILERATSSPKSESQPITSRFMSRQLP